MFGDKKTKSMPHANYVWLEGNPMFKGIPKGYVVHHLDLDQMNDDISNLVIMAMNHHRAYHLKHHNSTIPLEHDIKTESSCKIPDGLPITKPRAYYDKDRGSWRIYYRVRESDGRITSMRLGSFIGRKFTTKEDADGVIENLWGYVNWGSKGGKTLAIQ